MGILETTACNDETCGELTQKFEWCHNVLTIPFGTDKGKQNNQDTTPIRLDKLLKEEYFTEEDTSLKTGFDCGKAKGETHTSKKTTRRIIRLPRLMCIRLTRENAQNRTKSMRVAHFDVDNFDLSDYVSPEFKNVSHMDADGFSENPTYQLYGVISHSGASINGGHYVSYVRQGPNQTWFFCNDDIVTQKSLEELENAWFVHKGVAPFTPMMLFYKREDVEWEYARPPEGMK